VRLIFALTHLDAPDLARNGRGQFIELDAPNPQTRGQMVAGDYAAWPSRNSRGALIVPSTSENASWAITSS
jgi:hypothetical protein